MQSCWCCCLCVCLTASECTCSAPQVQESVSLVPEPARGRYWELLAHVSGMVDARDPERAEAAWVAYRLLLSQMMAAVKRQATSQRSLTLPVWLLSAAQPDGGGSQGRQKTSLHWSYAWA